MARYEFKDDIPKQALSVKMKDAEDMASTEQTQHGILQYISSFTLRSVSLENERQFVAGFNVLFNAFGILLSSIVLFLALFMMLVSFSQKMRDLSRE